MSPCSCGENDDEVGILGGRRAGSRGARGRSCHASSTGARHAGHASPPELAVPGKKRCDTSSSSAVGPRSRGRRSTRPTDLVERGWRSSSRGSAQTSRRRARGRWISSSAVGGARHAAVRRGAGGGRSGGVGLGPAVGPGAALLCRRAAAEIETGAGSGGHLGADAANRGRRSLGPQPPPPSSPGPQPTPPLRSPEPRGYVSSPPLCSPELGQLVPSSSSRSRGCSSAAQPDGDEARGTGAGNGGVTRGGGGRRRADRRERAGTVAFERRRIG
ncbi:unnamed protein product [Urochloa humidicola]